MPRSTVKRRCKVHKTAIQWFALLRVPIDGMLQGEVIVMDRPTRAEACLPLGPEIFFLQVRCDTTIQDIGVETCQRYADSHWPIIRGIQGVTGVRERLHYPDECIYLNLR